MKVMYAILAIAGWAWTAVVIVVAITHARKSRKMPRGFEVAGAPHVQGEQLQPKSTSS